MATMGMEDSNLYNLRFQTPKDLQVLLMWERGDEERKISKATIAWDFTHNLPLFIGPKGKQTWEQAPNFQNLSSFLSAKVKCY